MILPENRFPSRIKSGTGLFGIMPSGTKKGRAERASPAAGPGPARRVCRRESRGREGPPGRAFVDGKPSGFRALMRATAAVPHMSPSSQRPLPAVLAALAGFAIAAGAIRLEERLRRSKREPQKAPPGTVRASDEPRALQLERAVEPGRGRRADMPIGIPWCGWKDVFWRTVEQISADRLLLIAGGVVFYGLLATVPAITALVSMYGIFTPASSLSAQLNFLADVMP